MKKIKYTMAVIALALAPVVFSSCSDEEEPVKTPATASGTWTDPRDGETYGWVEIGGLQWMTENFRFDTGDLATCHNYIEPEDYYPYNETQNTSRRNRARWGMYYTYQAAVKACPEGWRLPTDEEWQKLECLMGMSSSDAKKWDWRGNIAHNLLSFEGNATEVNLLLGGFVTQHIQTYTNGSRFKGAYGYYWSGSKDENKNGDYYIFRKFCYSKKAIFRQSMENGNQLITVRYVRDASASN